MGGSGDHRQVKAKNSMHQQQPSTSVESIEVRLHIINIIIFY